jgi:hypothetical protein
MTGSIRMSPSDFGALNYPFAVTESLTGSFGSEGNLIISGKNGTATQSGSAIVSGSTNIFIPSTGVLNSSIVGGAGAGFQGRSNIVTVAQLLVTGSNGTGYSREYPQFINSVVNATMTITDNRPTITGSAPLSGTGTGFNGIIALTISTGSLAITNSNVIGTGTTINVTGSNGASKSIGSSLVGLATINMDTTNGNVLINSVVNGTGVSLLMSGSTNGVLQNVLIVGNTLSVTGSTSAAANLGSAYVGRFNETGSTALAANTAFAVGTGTSTTARKTSLHVSSSGLVTLTDSMIVTGSLTVGVTTPELTVLSTGVTLGNTITDIHTVTGSLSISGSVNAPSITGSLLGTASFATSASYALNSTSASYSLTSTSASFSNTSTSASFANNSTSASYALTASYAANAGSGGVAAGDIYSYTFLLMGA